MRIGTKSVLFGAHQFLLHPWFVAAAWWSLYGFPWDPRLWVAFFVHDLGYIGKANMDGAEGETHPFFGARLMSALFDRAAARTVLAKAPGATISVDLGQWGCFALLHSRYLAKTLCAQPSRLCIADKLAIALTPAWLYLPAVRATGEIREYMANAHHRVDGGEAVNDDERRRLTSQSEHDWYLGVQTYCRRWAMEHADGRQDTWTSDARNRATLGTDGVWK